MKKCIVGLLNDREFFDEIVNTNNKNDIKDKFSNQGIELDDAEVKEIAAFIIDRIFENNYLERTQN